MHLLKYRLQVSYLKEGIINGFSLLTYLWSVIMHHITDIIHYTTVHIKGEWGEEGNTAFLEMEMFAINGR